MSHLTRRQFAFLAAAGIARAQQQDATFSTDVRVVSLLATVRTKKGEIVRDLTKDDFTVLEAGRPQTIRYFSRESDLPLTIGLLVDTSMSQKRVLESERTASFHFLDQVLRDAKDQIFVMQFDMAMLMRQPLTASFSKLNEALSTIDTPSRAELSIPTSKGTVLYDAVAKASNEVMKKQTGRKALILLTDGVDFGSEVSLEDAIAAAQRADTLVYSVLFSDSGFYSGFGPDGGRVLRNFSTETGGGFFEVSKKRGIEQIFGSIEEDLRSEYNMGFVSDQPVRISEFRALQLTTKQKGLVVQARNRYWAQR